ncbi:RNA-binding protein [Pyrococcus kukulkanii]|uniref:DNA/RNA-binding protein Alba n=1 Tax=Pyrococcus kukulkanii TaxID=1609559 RepID=A0ABV4T857_9EURY
MKELLVGNKPLINYVLAGVGMLKDDDELVIKARGKAISKAVATAEMLRKQFFPGELEVTDVKIDSETRPAPELGREVLVASIEIYMRKKGN